MLLQPLWAAESFAYFSNLRGDDSSDFWRISSFLAASKPLLSRNLLTHPGVILLAELLRKGSTWEGSSMGGGALRGSQCLLNLHFSVIKPCSGFQQGLEAPLLSEQGRRMVPLLNLGHQDGPEGLM